MSQTDGGWNIGETLWNIAEPTWQEAYADVVPSNVTLRYGLRLVAGVDETGAQCFSWKLDDFEHANKFELIGLLETIKQEVVNHHKENEIMEEFLDDLREQSLAYVDFDEETLLDHIPHDDRDPEFYLPDVKRGEL